jgi:hypothetical protein
MDWIGIKYEINCKILHKDAKCARHWSTILQEWNIIQDSKPSSNWRIIFWD